MRINVPQLLNGLHERRPDGGRAARHTVPPERLAYFAWKEVLRRPWLYRLALRAARWMTWPLARGGWQRRLPGPGAAWTATRDFPTPAARSFRERWKQLEIRDADSTASSKDPRQNKLPKLALRQLRC